MKKLSNWFFVALFIVFSIVATLVGRESFIVGVKFVLTQGFFVFLPGLFLNSLSKVLYGNSTKFYLVSYAFGYGYSVLLYLICMFLGLQNNVYIPAATISLFSLLYLYKNRKLESNFDLKDIKFLSLLIVICYTISLLGFEGNTIVPDRAPLIAHPDYTYWLRNCVAVCQGLPLKDLSIIGQTFQYHYFSCAGIAFLHFISGIELFSLCFIYSYLIHLLLFVGSLYLLTDYVICNRNNRYAAMIIVAFVSGLEWMTSIYYVWHFYLYVAITEAYSFSFLTIYFFLRFYKEDGRPVPLFIISLFSFFLAIGLKATLSCIIFIGLGMGCLFILFKQNNWKKGITAGFFYSLFFILVFLILTSGVTIENSRNTYSFSFSDTILHSGYMKIIFEKLINFIHFAPLVYLIILFLYLFCLCPVLMFLGFKGFKRCKSISDVEILLFVIFGGGIVCGLCLSQFGMAQGYFIACAIPFGCIGVVSLYKDRNVFLEIKKSWICIFLICISTLSVLFEPDGIMWKTGSGLQNLLGLRSEQVKTVGTYFYLTKGELQGLRWVRDNIPSDAVLLSNKVLAPGGNSSSFTSAFSEHQVFYECYRYVDSKGYDHVREMLKLIGKAYDDDKVAQDILKNKGVNYIISYKLIENSDLMEGKIEYDGLRIIKYIPPKHKLSGNIIYENKDLYVVKL